MHLFEEVKLTWGGKEYTIPPDGMLRCIAEIEDVMTLGELANAQGKGRLPLAKLSTAFAIALRHAGASVTNEEVYAGMFEGGGVELRRRSMTAVFMLQAMMIPPESLRAPLGKAAGGAGRAAPSKKPTSSS